MVLLPVLGRAVAGPDGGEGEFDFEQAGARFNKEEELAKLFGKATIGDAPKTEDTGAQEGTPVVEAPPAIEVKKYVKVGRLFR